MNKSHRPITNTTSTTHKPCNFRLCLYMLKKDEILLYKNQKLDHLFQSIHNHTWALNSTKTMKNTLNCPYKRLTRVISDWKHCNPPKYASHPQIPNHGWLQVSKLSFATFCKHCKSCSSNFLSNFATFEQFFFSSSFGQMGPPRIIM